jgi:threonine/homoserine/homoserine lactone efflux protein
MFGIALSVALLFAANVATPGASFILTLRHSLTYGAPIGRRVALGLSVADAIYVVAALSGVAALFRLHAGLAATVGGVGGVWLGALGLALLETTRKAPAEQADGPAHEPLPAWQAFRIGLTAGLLNPQSVLFLSTVILASLHFEPSLGQALILGAVIALTSLATRLVIATIVAHRYVRERYLARRRTLEAVSGFALLAVGMRLAVKSVFPWAVKGVLLAGLALHVIQL